MVFIWVTHARVQSRALHAHTFPNWLVKNGICLFANNYRPYKPFWDKYNHTLKERISK